MFLHLGQDTVITTDNILGIFDIDTTTVSKATRNYLSMKEKNKDVINVSFELPKSFIVTCEEKTNEKKVYISPISSMTLLKRIENASYLKE